MQAATTQIQRDVRLIVLDMQVKDYIGLFGREIRPFAIDSAEAVADGIFEDLPGSA